MPSFTVRFRDGDEQEFTISGSEPTAAEMRGIQDWATRHGKGMRALDFAINEGKEGLASTLDLLGPKLYAGADWLLGGLLPDAPKAGSFANTDMLKSDRYAAPGSEGARLFGRISGAVGGMLPFVPLALAAAPAGAVARSLGLLGTSAVGAGAGEFTGEPFGEYGELGGGLIGGVLSPTAVGELGKLTGKLFPIVAQTARRVPQIARDLPSVFTKAGRMKLAQEYTPKSATEAMSMLDDRQRILSENDATREIQELVAGEPGIFGRGGTLESRSAMLAAENARRVGAGLPPIELNIAELTGSPIVERFIREAASQDIAKTAKLRGAQSAKQEAARVGTLNAMTPKAPAASNAEILARLQKTAAEREAAFAARQDEIATRKQELIGKFPQLNRLEAADAMRNIMALDRESRAARIGSKFNQLDSELAAVSEKQPFAVEIGNVAQAIRRFYKPGRGSGQPELDRVLDEVAGESGGLISLADARERFSFMDQALRRASRGDTTLDPRGIAALKAAKDEMLTSLNRGMDKAVNNVPDGAARFAGLRSEWRSHVQDYGTGVTKKIGATGAFGEDMVSGDKIAQTLLKSEADTARFMRSAANNPQQLDEARSLVLDFAGRRLFPGGELSATAHRQFMDRYGESLKRLGIGGLMDDTGKAINTLADESIRLTREQRAFTQDSIFSRLTDLDSAPVRDFLTRLEPKSTEAQQFIEAVGARDFGKLVTFAVKDETNMASLLNTLDDAGARGVAREAFNLTRNMSASERLAFVNDNSGPLLVAMRRGYGQKRGEELFGNLRGAAYLETLISDYSNLSISRKAMNAELETNSDAILRSLGTTAPSLFSAARAVIGGRGGLGHYGGVFTLQAMNAAKASKRAELLSEIYNSPELFESKMVAKMLDQAATADPIGGAKKMLAKKLSGLTDDLYQRGYYTGITLAADKERRDDER